MVQSQPEGWRTVTPRTFTADVDGLVQFLRKVFRAQGEHHAGRPAEMRIGDSIVMVSDGAGLREPSTTFLYVYVEDTDAVYHRALTAGARSLEPPANMPYGDRRATFQDSWGNTWQVATYQPGQRPERSA